MPVYVVHAFVCAQMHVFVGACLGGARVCACACAWVRGCVGACAWVRARGCVRARARAFVEELASGWMRLLRLCLCVCACALEHVRVCAGVRGAGVNDPGCASPCMGPLHLIVLLACCINVTWHVT